MLANMKQLHLATQQMALDSATTGDIGIGWPGDTGGTFAVWASNLVSGNYLSTNDLCKLLSGPGWVTPPGRIPSRNNHAVLVYAMGTNSSTNTVFLSSANLTNTPQGWITNAATPLFQHRYAVYLLSDGSGEITRFPTTNASEPPSRLHISGVPPTKLPYAPLLK